MRFIVAAIVVLSSLALSQANAAGAGSTQVTATLLADTSAIQPGRPFNVGVLLKITPQWHIYWNNPGDAGIPTTVKFDLPDGFTASPLRYPVPGRFEQAGKIIMFGYTDEVMLVTTITPPEKIDSSSVRINASPNWLVCDKNTCIPGNTKVSMTLPVGTAAASQQRSLIETWLGRMPVPVAQAGQVASYHSALQIDPGPKKSSGKVTLSIDWKADVPSQIEWFPPASRAVQFSKINVETKGKTTTITAAVEHLEGQKLEAQSLDSVVAFTTTERRAGVAVPVVLVETGW